MQLQTMYKTPPPHWQAAEQMPVFAVDVFPSEVNNAHGYHETQQNPCFPYRFFHLL
jgi:hypothetical protein